MSNSPLLLRFYALPILILVLCSSLSWAIFKYEYIEENKQFQKEFEYRAGGHTAAFQLGLEDISSHSHHLANFLTHEFNTDEDEAFKSNQAFVNFMQMFFVGKNEVRDVIVYEPGAAISNSLLDSPEHRVLHILHSDSPLHKQSIASMPAIMTIVKQAIQEQQERSFVLLKEEKQPWIYEVIPISDADGKRGCLLLSWDIGALVERVLTKIPVGGQDIRYNFGEALVLESVSETAAIRDNGYKAEYVHLSRSRQEDIATDDQRRFYWEDDLNILGRIWHIRYDSAPAFLDAHPVVNAWNIFYGGLLMSALLALLTLLIYRRARVIEGLVHIRTKQLNDAKKRMHLLVDSLAEGLFDMDAQGVCTFINQRALDLLGYQHANQVTGQNVHKLIHHSDADSNVIAYEHCQIANVMRTEKAIRVDDEVFWRADGSSFAVSYNATPVRNDAGDVVGIIVSFLDISAQLVAENEREQMRKQVEHTQRLESLGVLAGGIAHDFNNLLTSVIGNADMALHHLPATSPAVKHIHGIHKASASAADLCGQMLAYSGKSMRVMEALNISELVRDMGELLAVSISKHIEVNEKLANPIRLIDADNIQVQQIVMNLIINANEAIGSQEGKITLTTGVIDVNQDFLQGCYANANTESGSYVFFEVHDDGCGMDNATIERIFEPFFTTKFTGRGLGMSAVLGIVRTHGGAMKIDSAIAQGTCIRVLFPALDSESALLPYQQDRLENIKIDTSQHGGLVLVVDDEESLRTIAGMMFEDMGYEVLLAEDGLQALQVFAQHIDDIDLVLLDLTMPKMGGEACMEALQQLRSDVPILISSGYSEAQCAKFKNFLQKPYSTTALQEKVREMLNK